MFGVSKEVLQKLREDYPEGTRIEIVEMNDKFREMPAGLQGTVKFVDDIGTIHTHWDNGSTLGVAYGEDKIIKVKG